MHRIDDYIIKFIGAFLILKGFVMLFSDAQGIISSVQSLFRPSSFYPNSFYFEFAGLTIIYIILLPLTITAGYGLIKVRQWGWALAMVVCSMTLILSIYGISTFAIVSYQYRNISISQLIPEGSDVKAVSMWPTYIRALMSSAFILLLARKSIRMNFKYKKANA